MNDIANNTVLYPSEYVESITLSTGEGVVIRPILPEDAERLQTTFRRLSPETIFLRFLETFKELSDKQAFHFANVDYKTHMALVALIREADVEQIIGVARYALIQDRPESAEAAIVVRDDYQSKGLGSLLMESLVFYARNKGVRSFIATVHTSNARIRYFIQRSGLAHKRVMVEPGVWEIRIYLEEEGENN
jgi:acetyltransferase